MTINPPGGTRTNIKNEPMTQRHYIYYSYEEWGRGYLGARSCTCSPALDVEYMGSFRDKTFKPTQKIIIKEFSTRQEVLEAEVKLHAFFDVGKNPHFANLAKATSAGFNTLGVPQSEDHRKKISEALTGEKNPNFGVQASEETRRKMSEARTGVPLSEKHKESIREAKLGERNPNFGKTLSQDTKRKMSKVRVGKRWWVNEAGSTARQVDSPGVEWQNGRKWRATQ